MRPMFGDAVLTSVAQDDVPDIDCAVICTDHTVFDYEALVARHPLVVDTRNALRGHPAPSIFRL